MQSISNHLLKQLFYIAVIIVLGIILFWQMAIFIPSLLGAITFYVLMRRAMLFLTEKKKWKKGLTAMVLISLSFILFLVPLMLVVSMLSSKIGYGIEHSNEIIQIINNKISILESKLGYTLITKEHMSGLSSWIANNLPALLGSTFNFLTIISIMYFILYFMLMGNRTMEKDILKYVPLKNKNVSLLSKKFFNIIYSNAIGIPLTAIFQGIVATIGYWALGVSDLFFWFVATCLTSVIPIVGASLTYISISLIFFTNGATWKGIVLLGYGFGVVSTLDSFFRFALQKRMGNIHPLITLFGVIIGINLFGFIGVIFGPLLISLFILLIHIYSNEFEPHQE